MGKVFQDSIIRAAASGPHDPIYDGMFGPLDTLALEMNKTIAVLKAGNFVDPPPPAQDAEASKVAATSLWGYCQHEASHTTIATLSPYCRTEFTDPDERRRFLSSIENHCGLTLTALDRLRDHLATLPEDGLLDIKQANEHIQRARQALRQLASHAQRSALNIGPRPTGLPDFS